MDQYSYNAEYLMKNGEPWFPVMGEIHYSRVPNQYWKQEIRKMQAGGVDVISVYVFWLHHEEIEGEFDFTGDRDLHKFLKDAKECDAKVWLRIGPWCHGEARNGGFPDWLLQKDMDLRSNDPEYLKLVERLYTKIYEQAEGFFLKDGGPIIGVQIENEYGHVGGYTGAKGEDHMRTLKRMAEQIGFVVPFYTATGWGGAVTGGCIPVMGGYCDAPWDERITEIEPSGNYVLTTERNDHAIGSDHGINDTLTFDQSLFPFLTAELGGGLQYTRHRRTVPTGHDIGAMTLAKLGSGVNLLGYYMYHGGTNPEGKLTTLQESKATGYPNDLPELCYDFQGPIGEYGEISDKFREIKLYAMFVHDFGKDFCKMKPYMPADNPRTPEDLTSLRYCVRKAGGRGYLFIQNYQRHYEMAEHMGKVITVDTGAGDVTFPALNIKNGDYAFYPFHMKIGDATLISCDATPLCILRREEPVYIFYADHEPTFTFDHEMQGARIHVISRQDALNAYKIKDRNGLDVLAFTDGVIYQGKEGYVLASQEEITARFYPGDADIALEQKGVLTGTVLARAGEDQVIVNAAGEEKTFKTFELDITYPASDVGDAFLKIDYSGNEADLYRNGKKVADWFYTGNTWSVGLKKLGFPDTLTLTVEPLPENEHVYLEIQPQYSENVACSLDKIRVTIEQVSRFY
ncbi:MAG: beta-galactosidase [Lachnospiraceae bacterium]|nr:beta-galactosidase [Lachnospiraceae bacterium]